MTKYDDPASVARHLHVLHEFEQAFIQAVHHSGRETHLFVERKKELPNSSTWIYVGKGAGFISDFGDGFSIWDSIFTPHRVRGP